MKRIISIMLLIAAVSATTFGQEGKPLKLGIEVDGKLKKVDPNTSYDSPTGVAYVGMFAEFYLTNHFSGKLRAGLNNTYYNREDHITNYPDNGTSDILQGISAVKPTLGVSFEPRVYLFSTEQLRKINFYAALPVVFETAPAWKEKDSEVRAELAIIPTLGINYDFTKHWRIEASGGIGWGKYFSKGSNPNKNQEMEYCLSAGLRYAF